MTTESRTRLVLSCAAVLVFASAVLAPQPVLAQFVCDSTTPGGADGATATSTNSFACGTDATAVGTDSTAIGAGAGASIISPATRDNTAVGSSAGRNIFGNGNSALGVNAGRNVGDDGAGVLSASNRNSAFGVDAGNRVFGDSNSAFGDGAGQDVGLFGTAVIPSSRNSAFGAGAGTGVFGNGNAAFGDGAGRNVFGDNNVAIGTSAGGDGLPVRSDTIAIGTSARATHNDAIAVGRNARAAFTNSAAFGQGTTTDRDDQQKFGTDTNTYTMTGVATQKSRDEQAANGGPTHIVTSNEGGDLAAYSFADLGLASSGDLAGLQSQINGLGQRDDELADGIAISLAIAQPIFHGNQAFATWVGYGNFDGTSGIGASAAGIIDRGSFGPTSTVTLGGGIGAGTSQGTVAGRVGMGFGW